MGRVYLWTPDSSRTLGGRVTAAVVPLLRLASQGHGRDRLCGRYVYVRNGGVVNEPAPGNGTVYAMPIGDAQPNAEGDFMFEPGHGGGRIDKVVLAEPDFRWRYIQASHFGEVNTYYHLDRLAAYVDGLLQELGAVSLPQVMAVVNAHHAATEQGGIRDGIRRGERWVPFEGGHYRLPARRYSVSELEPITGTGEIHLGPGRRLLAHGALVEAAGGRYWANASHNAGTLYHEYGHHITRHTADFQGNALRRPDAQDNRKTALDEGMCDYWVATMLGSPHIWAWHNRHDVHEAHRRSLTSSKTMADYDSCPGADEHGNGTIWAAALWDLRTRMASAEQNGARGTDLLVLKTLLLIGTRVDSEGTIKGIRRVRGSYAAASAALLQADGLLNAGRHRELILTTFAQRGIEPRLTGGTEPRTPHKLTIGGASAAQELERILGGPAGFPAEQMPAIQGLLKHVAPEEIPATADVWSAEALEAHLGDLEEAPFSLIAVGDVMLGDRAQRPIAEHGIDYPFEAVRPLLRRAEVVLANLEGPFARVACKMPRHYSFRMNPRVAAALTRAGIGVVTLANNHLLDCGRAGVLETLEVLAGAGVSALGAGVDERAAHAPSIQQAGRWRVGLLGYYWNRRCAATRDLAGSAVDGPAALEADICGLRKLVDRIVVSFHWGVPYVREPSLETRAKARFAVDCGADVVIGHHPHIVQPLEIYRGCPILYSVGNCAMGSGNSHAEGLAVGLRFEETRTAVCLYPLYVKNRDPRVDYQPKALGGRSGEHLLGRLAEISGASGQMLRIEGGCGRLDLPRPCASWAAEGRPL